MKKLTATTIGILTAGLCLAADAAQAGPQDESIVAKVPFDFVAGSVEMPAGKYIVRPASDDPSVALIESADGRHASFALTIPTQQRSSGEPTLVFEKRENGYVLTRLVESDGDGREIVAAHASREREVPLPLAQP
jgi:hypothetical protein